MEKLLHWSIAQQAGDKEALSKIGNPDPKTLNQLFGGPDEATLMKESIAVVKNSEADLESKIVALENFEMLIENLDNANNIENLKLWPSIIEILGAEDSDDEIKVLILSIIGIAVQNNTKSQTDFLKYEDGLKLIIVLGNSNDESIKSKALFAVSSLIRDFPPGFKKFEELNGLNLIQLDPTLNKSKHTLRILSVISSTLSNGLDNNVKEYFIKKNIVMDLAHLLNANSLINIIDKTLNIISNLNRLAYPFNKEEKTEITNGIRAIEDLGEKLNEDDLNAIKEAFS